MTPQTAFRLRRAVLLAAPHLLGITEEGGDTVTDRRWWKSVGFTPRRRKGQSHGSAGPSLDRLSGDKNRWQMGDLP